MCYHISFEVNLESIVDYFPDIIIDPQLEINFPKAAYVNGFDHGFQPAMLTGRKDGKKHFPLQCTICRQSLIKQKLNKI